MTDEKDYSRYNRAKVALGIAVKGFVATINEIVEAREPWQADDDRLLLMIDELAWRAQMVRSFSEGGNESVERKLKELEKEMCWPK